VASIILFSCVTNAWWGFTRPPRHGTRRSERVCVKRRYFVLRTATHDESVAHAVRSLLRCTHVLLYYKSQENAATGTEPTGAIPVFRELTNVSETTKKVRGVSTPCVCVKTPGWHHFYVVPESDSPLEWARVIRDLDPPPNAAEIRSNSIGNGSVASVTLDALDDAEEEAEDTRGSPVGITLCGVKELRALVAQYNSDRHNRHHHHRQDAAAVAAADDGDDDDDDDDDDDGRIVRTADVAKRIVKPATEKLSDGQQAFVHIDNGKHRDFPTCFVSHAWHADAAGLLDAVVNHGDDAVSAGRSPPVYFLDLTSVDQHHTDQVSDMEMDRHTAAD
jgi:hypothetical protein